MSITPPAAEAAVVARTVGSVAAPGASLAGAMRRELAQRSRRAASASPEPSGGALDALVEVLTRAPDAIREDWVAGLREAGIDAPVYVEVLGVVARVRAIDTFHFALGLPPAELPPAIPGAPTGEVELDARLDGGWVPTVGRAGPPNALSAVPGEHRAMHDLHGAFYLAVAEMGDLDAERGLHRTQMELVAARTSLLNECFY